MEALRIAVRRGIKRVRLNGRWLPNLPQSPEKKIEKPAPRIGDGVPDLDERNQLENLYLIRWERGCPKK
ncbi:hypothetical protein BNJ_00420 [Kaumoebavirus]|uniref:hypothetical protein n=1 Tax=Kaumoebavirus TaxID=1859492 RepID=UPI0009C1F1FE|nr:hypothetical protein BNJ_00420 [Kaumoebavirus]ARA72235.1 hypothetical protein BNJ_00420 [Kaumoebavirus]